MKPLYFLVSLVIFISCNNRTKQQNQLPGDLKYTSYQPNNTKDSFGLSLNHYLQIAKDGNYRLLLRNAEGQASYYYGFVGYDNIAELNNFMRDSSIGISDTLQKAANGLNFKLDYATGTGEKQFKFTPQTIPEQIKSVVAKLDSIISSPGKKQSSHFNIDDYLKKIITEDSAGRLISIRMNGAGHLPKVMHGIACSLYS